MSLQQQAAEDQRFRSTNEPEELTEFQLAEMAHWAVMEEYQARITRALEEIAGLARTIKVPGYLRHRS